MARSLAFLCLVLPVSLVAFVDLWPVPRSLRRTCCKAGSSLWQEAYDTERSRSDLLLSKLKDLEDLGARESCGALEEVLQDLLEQSPLASQESFDALRRANDQLDEALQELQSPRLPSSLPSLVPSSKLPGDPVTIDVLPPVRETDGPALVPGAAHVRVSLPLVDNSEVMWGCDLTPLYDEVGSRLMSFTAFLPMGMQLTSFPRPSDLPGDADLVMVEEVESKGEADVIGIQAGDILRAVSYVGTGPEPGWLDKMLGAEAMPMKKVMKCDGRSIDEVTDALQSNRDSPDGRLVLLLERPQ
eukprot:symbB.v1.2.027581.t1/scaffold2840.1/size69153/6